MPSSGERLVVDGYGEVHSGGWHFLWLNEPRDHPDFALLRAFVHKVVLAYDLDDRIPACWEYHEILAEEMAALYRRYVVVEEELGKADADGVAPATRYVLTPEDPEWPKHVAEALERIKTHWNASDCTTAHRRRAYNRWAKPAAKLGEAEMDPEWANSYHEDEDEDEESLPSVLDLVAQLSNQPTQED
ncbi:MAG: hypothetical protein ACYCS4_12940 [Acidimicrobiales bacterium]